MELRTLRYFLEIAREDSGLCFRPLEPTLETKMYIIWKKYQVFSPIAELFVKELRGRFEGK